MNSLLIEYDVCDYENFILPKSMHLCMIRFIHNTNTCRGEQQGMEDHMENMKINSFKILREEREVGAQEEGMENKGAVWKTSLMRQELES